MWFLPGFIPFIENVWMIINEFISATMSNSDFVHAAKARSPATTHNLLNNLFVSKSVNSFEFVFYLTFPLKKKKTSSTFCRGHCKRVILALKSNQLL